jgi:hypothetical protein
MVAKTITKELIYSLLNFFKSIFFEANIFPYHLHIYTQLPVVDLSSPTSHNKTPVANASANSVDLAKGNTNFLSLGIRF